MQKARLISRDFLHGAAQLFGKLLSNTVFTLTPGCLEFLDELSRNIQLSRSIRTLTFGSTYIPQLKPYRERALRDKGGSDTTMTAVNDEIIRAWHITYELQKGLFKNGEIERNLSKILSQFKGLKNIRFRPHVKIVRCSPYTGRLVWPTKELQSILTTTTAKLGHAVIETFRKSVYDDIYVVFPIIQKALSMSGLRLESLVSTSLNEPQRQKGLLAFYDRPMIPLSDMFGHMRLFYWAVPASPKRLMNSTRRFTTMLSSILNNAPNLKAFHIVCTVYPKPKIRHLPMNLAQTPQLELLDLEGIGIDRDSLLALVSNQLRKLRLAQIPDPSSEDWAQILHDIRNRTPLGWLKLECGLRERCLTHGNALCNCGTIPESVFKSISSKGTIVLCIGDGSWRGSRMVYRMGEALGPRDEPDVRWINRLSRFGLPFTLSHDGSHLAGTI